MQLSPPKAKIDAILAGLQENVSNPAQDWRGGYVKLFGGKDDHALPFEERLTQTSILGDKLGMVVAKAWLRDQEKIGGMSSDIKFLDVELTSHVSLFTLSIQL